MYNIVGNVFLIAFNSIIFWLPYIIVAIIGIANSVDRSGQGFNLHRDLANKKKYSDE